MATIAYLRVSTDKQDLDNQKLHILDYAHKQKIKISNFFAVQISSRKSVKERKINELLGELKSGDLLIVSELSRLGRSLGQVIRIVDNLIKNKIKFTAIKENINLDGKQNIQTKVMIAMFGLFAEIERDLISERTKQGLVAARTKGKLLGRPKGSIGKSKLDGKETEIAHLLELKVSKASIAKILGISRTALHSFINSRKISM